MNDVDSRLRPFSSGYYMAELRVIEYEGEEALIDADLFYEYREFVNEVNVKRGNVHWAVKPSGSVPADTLVLPSHEDKDGVYQVLVVKDKAFNWDGGP